MTEHANSHGVSKVVADSDREVLLRLALGDYESHTVHRYRHKVTGETAARLDLRLHDIAEWDSESSTVIATRWERS